VVAVATSNGVFVSWRMLGSEADSVAYNVYRNGSKLTASPLANSTNYVDTAGSATATYRVAAVVGGVEQVMSCLCWALRHDPAGGGGAVQQATHVSKTRPSSPGARSAVARWAG